MKRCTKWLSLTLALLMIVSLIPFGTLTAVAEETQIPPQGYTNSGNYISNEYLKFQVSSDRMALHTASGDRLLYGALGQGSSYALLSVGGSLTRFNPTVTYVNEDGTSLYSYMKYNSVLIERYCTFSLNTFTGKYDTLEIRFVATNLANAETSFGVRYSFDTMIGSNDSAPFRAVMDGSAEQITITTGKEYTGNSIPKFWYAYQSLNDASSLVGSGTFYADGGEKPDKVQFLQYSNMKDSSFNNTISTGSLGDSAVNIYFNATTLTPNESRTVSTFYGLSSFAGSVDPTNKLNVYAMVPVTLTANENNTAYLSNPFQFVATIKNTGNTTLTGVVAELVLPEDLEVADGQSLSYEIGTMTKGADINHIWSLMAAKQGSERTLRYKLRLTAEELDEPIEAEYTLRLPALHVKHVPGAFTVDEEPTCTEAGSRHATCKVCGETVYETIPATHNYGEIVYEKTIDCEHGGYGYKVCTVCGYKQTLDYIPALGHSYISRVTRAATCTEDGIVTYTCTRCGDSYEVTTHAEHHYELTVVEAGCYEDGASIYTCSKCGDAYSIAIPASHDYESKVTKKASADADGEITYTCRKCGDSYTEAIPARKSASILLVQDGLPWNVDSASAQLRALVNDGYLTGWDAATTRELDSLTLTDYDVIYIANDQTTATYSRLSALNELLTEYAMAGGVVIYGACDRGWAGGNISDVLPGGVKKINNYSKYNYILDNTHLIVTGALTDNKALTNELLVGNYCSHTSFDKKTLPDGFHTILQDGAGNPTLVEYPMGEGTIILSGLTWEFYYDRNYTGSTSYAKCVFDDLLVYATMMGKDTETCDHVYDEGDVVDPTCTEVGYTLHTCTLCGASYKDQFVEALGHRTGVFTVTVEPGCEHEGLREAVCSECGEKVVETIAALGHTSGDWIVDEEATEFETGYKHKECTVCGEVSVATEIPAIGHTWGEIQYKEAPDCEHGAYGYRTCLTCGDSEEVGYVPARGHSYVSEVTRAATCTEDGIVTYTCTHCNKSYTVTTHAEHHYVLTVKAATCTKDGASVYTCSVCGDAYSETIPASHAYEPRVTKKASQSEDGEITYTCTKCGDSYTKTIPARVNANVLLVQDNLPWSDDNAADLLLSLCETGYLTGWDITTTAGLEAVDLSIYNVIYIANDQTSATYGRLARANELLTEYAKAGGVLVYGACDNGWAGGNISDLLPGGVKKINNYSKYNYILDGTHMIVSGVLTDNRALTNELLVGTYCSHTSFDASTLPEGYHAILEDNRGNPTLVEYPMGDGTVILSGLTWEFYYSRIYQGSTSYSKNVFDDLLVYAAMLSNLTDADVCEHLYADEGDVVDPTCTEVGYTLHTCTKCGASYKDSFVPATGHHMSESKVTREADCEHEGELESVCSECGETVTEVIAPLGHDWGEWITDRAADYDHAGEKHRVCKTCGAESLHAGIQQLVCDHTHVVKDAAAAATCTADGLTEGSHCADCKKVLKAQETVPMLGHNWGEWKVVKEATTTVTGSRERSCKTCGKTETETIAKLPESETSGKANEKTTEANGSGKEYTSVGSLFGCMGAVSASESVVVLVAVLALGGVMMLVKSKKSKKKKDEEGKKAE